MIIRVKKTIKKDALLRKGSHLFYFRGSPQ